jgi:hypothetical protein
MTAEIDEQALYLAHKAVEDALIAARDNRTSLPGWANGLVVREADGTDSGIIRLSTRNALQIGIRTYLAALAHEPTD